MNHLNPDQSPSKEDAMYKSFRSAEVGEDWSAHHLKQTMKQSITNHLGRRAQETSYWVLAVVLLLFGLYGTRASVAQTSNASISGHIVDTTAAVVTDAAVTLTDVDTHIAIRTMSNAEGLYTFPSVKPGNYTLTVSRAGFRILTIKGLTAGVQASLSRDVVLQIGAATQTVTVTAEEADEMVAQTSSELGTQIGEHQIHDLPLNGRNFTELLTLTPGASPIGTSQSAQTGIAVNDQAVLGIPGSTFSLPSIQGQIGRENVYLLDGVVDTDFRNGVYVIPPIIDDMQEFVVQSHDDKAEYGGVLGGIVNVVTKSGTNNFHGAAWEFVRNNIFDARDSFTDEYSSAPSPYRQNMFGATVGGPVWLPHLYNGRNRTFFEFGYEGWRYSQSSETLFNLPTAAELSGDFSHSILPQNIYDPATTTQTANGYTRQQFDYNGVPNTINPARLDQNVVNFFKTYDSGLALTGNPNFNAYFANPHTDNADHYTVRIDEQLGSKDTLFFREDLLNVVNLVPNSYSQNTSSSVPARNLAAGWSRTFTPNILFDLRFGTAMRPFKRGQNVDTHGLGPLMADGFTSAGGTLLGLQAPYETPGIGNGYGSELTNTISNPVYNYSPTLTWVRGMHNIKFGMQYIRQGNGGTSPAFGDYNFTNAVTGDPNNVGTTGNSLASALLGLPSANASSEANQNGHRFSSYGFFAQDAWTVSRNVTVTYGLRLDHRRPFAPDPGTVISGPSTDGDYWIGLTALPAACNVKKTSPCIPSADGSLASIDGGVAASDPTTGIPYYNAADPPIQLSPYGVTFGAKGGWDIGPRVGIAWRVNPKTTVRGGYGFVYDPTVVIDQAWSNGLDQWPYGGGGGSIAMNQTGSPLTTIESTFGQVNSVLPTSDPWSLGSWYLDPHDQDPRSQQFNLTVERELGSNTTLSVGYVGGLDDRLQITGQWNTAETPGVGTAAQVRARTPFPWYNTSSFYSTSNGTSDYNALQVKLDRKFSNGLQYLVAYTYSKALGTGGSGLFGVENGPGGFSVWQNYYDLKASRGVLAFSVPQVLTMEGQYALPVGIGQRYLNHGPVAYILGNWQANTNLQIRSGQPYNMAVSGDVANIEAPAGDSWYTYERPNVIGNPKLAHPTRSEGFNTTAFQVPATGTYGNAGTSPLYSMHVADADMSLFKNFSIREKMSFTFRAEAFNVFNIQNYGVPDSTITDTTAGVITSNVTNPREIQLGLHLNF
jgi:outer membrane receptor protein involved in Fe transport